MKNMIKFILFLAAIAGVAGVAYVTKNKREDLDDSNIQYLTCLRLEKVLEWCERKLVGDGKFLLRILPNEATLKAFSGKLNLSEKDLSKCLYIIVSDSLNENIVLRKVVIPQEISQELSVLKEGIVYTVPIN